MEVVHQAGGVVEDSEVGAKKQEARREGAEVEASREAMEEVEAVVGGEAREGRRAVATWKRRRQNGEWALPCRSIGVR